MALGLALAVAQPAWAATPTATLRAFFQRANAVLRSADPERGPDEPRRAIRALVNEAFDFREAAALALGPVFGSRTPDEQEEFVRLFADLLERGYVATLGSKVSAAGGVTVDYQSESIEGESAIVSTTLLTRSGGALPVEYRMIRRGAGWAVRDVVVDGVSLAANYRAQFNRVLRDSSYADLIARMREDSPAAPAGAPVALREEVRLTAHPAAPPDRAPAPQTVAKPATGETTAALSKGPVPGATYWVQVGAFKTAAAAIRAVERLRPQAVTIASSALSNAAGQPTGALARVLVGPFSNRAEAAAKLGELLSRGYEVFIAETRD